MKKNLGNIFESKKVKKIFSERKCFSIQNKSWLFFDSKVGVLLNVIFFNLVNTLNTQWRLQEV